MKKYLILFLLIFWIKINFVSGQAGALDKTFGSNGIVLTNIGYFDDEARSVAIQTDGKIIIAGSSYGLSYDDFAIIRYNSDGTFDTTFGNKGIVLKDFNDSNDEASSVIIQPDKKILVAGQCQISGRFRFALIRLLANGKLDNSFGKNGVDTITVGVGDDHVNSALLQPDGKIVLAGSENNGTDLDYALVRYDSNGSLDTTFGTKGVSIIPISNMDDECMASVLQKNGKIIAAGYSGSNDAANYAVVRLNSNGKIDNSFGTNGIDTNDFLGYADFIYSAIIQKDGKIIVSGMANNSSSFSIGLIRYDSNGLADNSFGNKGKVITSVGLSSMGDCSAIQPDGKIIVGGGSINSTKMAPDFTLLRYKTDGSLDTSFNGNGIVTNTLSGGDDVILALTLQPDGKILTAGYSDDGTGNIIIALARYLISKPATGLDDNININKNLGIYPDPFNNKLNVSFTMKQPGNITACLYDLQGRIVKNFINNKSERSGLHDYHFILNNDISEGSYIFVLTTPDNNFYRKVVKAGKN